MVDHNIFNLFFPLIMFFPLVGFTPPPPFSDPSPRFMCLREAAKKKVPPLMAGPLRGGGGKGRAIKEKKFRWSLSSRGGGLRTLWPGH